MPETLPIAVCSASFIFQTSFQDAVSATHRPCTVSPYGTPRKICNTKVKEKRSHWQQQKASAENQVKEKTCHWEVYTSRPAKVDTLNLKIQCTEKCIRLRRSEHLLSAIEVRHVW